MQKTFFFRNDDVRGSLDESLVRMTDIFLCEGVPISHGVEPANVSPEVVSWLLEKKREYPTLLEIVQHGFDHRLNYRTKKWTGVRKGEFGGPRTYLEQRDEIHRGKEIMDNLFGDQWFPLFTFPYSSWNASAIKALDDEGFNVVNGKMGITFPHRVFYLFGRALKKQRLLDFNVSWNMKYAPGTNIFTIDTAVDLIKRIYDEHSYEFVSMDGLKKVSLKYMDQKPNIGFVLHHRFHQTEESFELLKDLIFWLKSINDIEFSSMEGIFREFSHSEKSSRPISR